MFIPVLYISSLIHIFSTDYMAEDPHNQRFFSYLSLFTFFMLVLVSGANFFVMFVDYATIFSIVPFMNETAITIIGLLLLTGAMAKSAQIPLHS
jgi:NADH:ubiquinone oxidoreductase subunit 5 (subunit L)/multisubunit Na+/H+ antiporter MnhA subunit